MRASEMFPSKYMKSSDAKNKAIVATISHMKRELVGQGQDQKEKSVLYFEDQKPLVLNKTNANALDDAFGDSEDWPGHKVKIVCVETSYAGKATDGLRVRPIVPRPSLKHDLNDEIPI
jgi:hypothetical protein